MVSKLLVKFELNLAPPEADVFRIECRSMDFARVEVITHQLLCKEWHGRYDDTIVHAYDSVYEFAVVVGMVMTPDEEMAIVQFKRDHLEAIFEVLRRFSLPGDAHLLRENRYGEEVDAGTLLARIEKLQGAQAHAASILNDWYAQAHRQGYTAIEGPHRQQPLLFRLAGRIKAAIVQWVQDREIDVHKAQFYSELKEELHEMHMRKAKKARERLMRKKQVAC